MLQEVELQGWGANTLPFLSSPPHCPGEGEGAAMGFNRLKAMDFYRKIPRCAAPPARPPILPGVAGGRGGKF